MTEYDVTGMSCAACAAHIEKAVSAVPGVSSCAVSLMTDSMTVEGDAPDSEVVKAVKKAGYGASPRGAKNAKGAGKAEDAGSEVRTAVARLATSAAVLAVLMYFSMGLMHGWLPSALAGRYAAVGVIELILSAAVMVINQRFFINGFRALFRGGATMDTLVALGSSASFCYSVYALFRVLFAPDGGQAMTYAGQFWFESAAMILVLISVGKLLEAVSRGRATDALRGLMALSPPTALKIVDGNEVEVPLGDLLAGDLFAVRPGSRFPADGEVVEGGGAVDESALTGESVPVDKLPGDRVSAGTANASGYFVCRARSVGADTALAGIIKTVADASASKAPAQRIADKVSGVFVPVVMGIALVTFAVWMIVGRGFAFSIERAVSVLVISCPCALGLATPVAITVGSGKGAKNGILFKTAEALENTGKTQIVALDKTGTVTKGEPAVVVIEPAAGVARSELLEAACAVENMSEHPLARARVSRCREEGFEPRAAADFRSEPGVGVSCSLDGRAVRAGKLSVVSAFAEISPEDAAAAEKAAKDGVTVSAFCADGKYLGFIGLADEIRPDSAKAVAELRGMGIRPVMITGDNADTARAIAAQAGIDEVIAGVLPNEKEKAVRELKKQGRVAMVGDGVNDAPALTSADTGIAVGTGMDVAVDASTVVIMNDRLTDVPAAIRLSRATLRDIRQNLFWAFFYNIIGIPLAAGAFIAAFGWELDPMFGAAAMSVSSFLVVMNALRLNLVDIRSAKRDRPIKSRKAKTDTQKKGPETMKKTLKIEGMMCPHCEMNVKNALEALDGVEEAAVSHVSGTAEVTLTSDVADGVLADAVTAKGYKVLGVE